MRKYKTVKWVFEKGIDSKILEKESTWKAIIKGKVKKE